MFMLDKVMRKITLLFGPMMPLRTGCEDDEHGEQDGYKADSVMLTLLVASCNNANIKFRC